MRAIVASKHLLSSGLGRLGLCVVAVGALGGGLARSDSKDSGKPEPIADPVAVGYEIFNREWMPNDPRGHGGDGLGPAFNDSSCVACHNSGGSGGAGPISKNIDILSASRNQNFMGNAPAPAAEPALAEPPQVDPAASFATAARPAVAPGAACPPPTTAQLEPLFEIHPGFRTSKTVVLHKFGIDPGYDAFRTKLLNGGQPQGFVNNGTMFVTSGIQMVANTSPFDVIVGQSVGQTDVNQGQPDARANAALARMNEVRQVVAANRVGMGGTIQFGAFQISRSQRNPTPLFGLGLIDAIPEAAIEANARQQAKKTPEIAGRPARVKDGRIGRLGWKGQTANSEDFVLNACAVEVGLEVPGVSQAMTPQAPRYKGPGLDLTAGECNSLVAYVRSIPRPIERVSSTAVEAKFLAAGKATFAKIGCAGCHTSKLAEVEGLYSDLLIHDMGEEMADSGSYNGNDDSTEEPLVPLLASENGQPQPVQQARAQGQAPKEPKTARKNEWRTPPLWGFRDSGPYLHDGRAQTLEQAVALHGGQGSESAKQFFLLSPTERLQLEAFLKSLVAPAEKAGHREMARAGN